jgi:hypothetical protein
MHDISEVAKFNLMRFLTSRMGRGNRGIVAEIVRSLSEKRSKGIDDGWVRARDLYNEFVRTGEITHSTQFFRILEKLVEFNVIQRELREKEPVEPGEHGEPGARTPVYYRVPIEYPDSWFWEEPEDPIDTMSRLNAELSVAKEWIGELTEFDSKTVNAKITEKYKEKKSDSQLKQS